MEAQAFAAFAQYGALGLIALGACIAAWRIINAQHGMIKEISARSSTAIENNTVAMHSLGERMTDVEDRLENVENSLEKER